MKILGLPGRNPETESWLHALLELLDAGESTVARYSHWEGGGEPDVAAEAGRHPAGAADLAVAKSMGTMVLLASAVTGSLPEAAVLIGTPLKAYTAEQVAELQALMGRIPCLFIQQTNDFTGSAGALRDRLGETAEIEEVAGSDHVYSDVAELAGLIRGWQGAQHG